MERDIHRDDNVGAAFIFNPFSLIVFETAGDDSAEFFDNITAGRLTLGGEEKRGPNQRSVVSFANRQSRTGRPGVPRNGDAAKDTRLILLYISPVYG